MNLTATDKITILYNFILAVFILLFRIKRHQIEELDDHNKNSKKEGNRAENSGEKKDEIEKGDHLQRKTSVKAPENFGVPSTGSQCCRYE